MSVLIDRVDDVVVSCSLGEVSAADIDRLVDLMSKQPTKTYLAGAAGDVSLDSSGRSKLFEVLKKNSIRIVGVTDSKIMKGILTAASWMGVKVSGVSWAEVEEGKKIETLDHASVSLLLDLRRRMS